MYKKTIKGLHLITPESDEELNFIARLYARQNPVGMIPVDIQKVVIEFRKALKSGAYIKMIQVDEEIHGFIGGTQVNILHISEKCVQQLYYYCDLEAMEAFRAVLLAHEGLVRYAENLKAKYVISPCSQFYNNDSFVKILKTQGWQVFGFLAVWKTSHNEYPSSNPRA